MASYTQAGRPIVVHTPLGSNKLLLSGFTGTEAMSELFHFDLDLFAENGQEVAFDQLLGQPVSLELEVPGRPKRFFHGIISRFSQGQRNTTYTVYRAEVVPQVWLLTRSVQSRIFQHQSIPDILKSVFEGLDVVYQLRGKFHPRDYCVQYRESDFAFASRLMEEEGIYYFFQHAAAGHKMVVSDSPYSHPDLPGDNRVIYETVEGGHREEDRVHTWQKTQGLRSAKYTLWDHSFELPHKHLEATRLIPESVQVGAVTHQLRVGANERLEVYDYPGGYARRFDGVNPGGGARPAEVQKIYEDNQRTAAIRMQQEALPSLEVRGTGTCGQFLPGYQFILERHFDANGPYVLTRVEHTAKLPGVHSGNGSAEYVYTNAFTCIPAALPFRPLRRTPRPVVHGTQTAVVVGPKGEEIFTDKYGRVKVQFHWDRQGKYNADSSCWIRVSTTWAGKQWGFIQIPRIGQEVIVDFLEGDPDRPIIVGSVYNADMMPPAKLPDKKMCSGMKSNSTPGGGGYNEISLDDTKGKEKIIIHGEHDMNTTVEHDHSLTVHHDRTINVDGTHTETIKKETKITISEENYTLDVAKGKSTHHVQEAVTEIYDDTQTTVVEKKIAVKSSKADIDVSAATQILLHCGKSSILLKEDGTIEVKGRVVTVDGSEDAKLQSATKAEVVSDKETVMGVGTQTVKCDPQAVTTSGAAINTCADGTHTITGTLIKIN